MISQAAALVGVPPGSEAYRQERAILIFLRQYSAPLFLLVCLLLGGASAAGIWANAALQLLSIALILTILLSNALPLLPRPARWLLWLFALAAVLMAAQLMPLPPAIWEGLPGRPPLTQALFLAKVTPGWQPITLTPDATIATLMAMLPPVAMALAILASAQAGRRYSMRVLVAVALLSILLGACQRAGGPDSPLYPYAITNRGYAVGLFANRNHLGTLLLCALPFLPLAMVGNPRHKQEGHRLWILMPLALLLAGGALLTGSRAVMILLLPVLAACCLNVWPLRTEAANFGRKAVLISIPLLLLLLLLLLAVAGAWTLAAHGGGDPQHRDVITPRTLHAARDYAPFGSGGGSFQRVYPSYEDPEAATPEYINHAHDDYAEIALEYGVAGLLLLGAALVLWARRTWAAWATDISGPACARAASIASGVVILHSLVDYPARTAAIAAVTAMAAALLVSPVALVEGAARRSARRARTPSLAVMIDEL